MAKPNMTYCMVQNTANALHQVNDEIYECSESQKQVDRLYNECKIFIAHYENPAANEGGEDNDF